MKKMFTLIALFVSLSTFANTIIVKGYVRDSTGKSVANRYVRIATDTLTSNTCAVSHYKITDANGFYADTVTCSGSDIKKLLVTTESCGTIITKQLSITTNITECNFTVCLPPVVISPPVLTFVIVKGYVKDSSGKAIANHLVKIFIDSTYSSSCIVSHIIYTNANGFYIDTLYCNVAIKYVGVSSEVCGTGITHKVAVANGIAESNFTICVPPIVPPPSPPILNFVIVKGYVKDSSGKAIANHLVKIFIDSTFGSTCNVLHSKYTNANGFYIDTLYCSTPIKYVSVSSEACGRIVTNNVAVTNGVVESNFIICLPATVTPPTVPACNAYFVYTQQLVGVKFNSNVSLIAPNDTIIGRKWSFGDGDSAYNLVDPIHVYRKTGTYTACLSIKTAKGCESNICKAITLNDSLPNASGSILEPVKIVILYPNPVHEKMNVLVWNYNTNTAAELSIVDIYGQRKWSSKINLLKGNNSIDINASFLANGPYFFKVTTPFGIVSRKFYKL